MLTQETKVTNKTPIAVETDYDSEEVVEGDYRETVPREDSDYFPMPCELESPDRERPSFHQIREGKPLRQRRRKASGGALFRIRVGKTLSLEALLREREEDLRPKALSSWDASVGSIKDPGSMENEVHDQSELERATEPAEPEKPRHVSEEAWAQYLTDRHWFENEKSRGRIGLEHRGRWIAVYDRQILMSDSDLPNLYARIEKEAPNGGLFYVGEFGVAPVEASALSSLEFLL